MKKQKNKYILYITITTVILTQLFAQLAIATSFTPATIEKTLNPGESVNETKIVITDPTPLTKADILFSFDLTGSMGSIIGTAKSRSIEIMNKVSTKVPNAEFGVVSYMDYPNHYSSFVYSRNYGYSSCGDYAYALNQPITNDKTAVSNAINALSLGCGGDGPQDYTRVMYESYADTSISWRAGSKKILVNFGDNVPHDNNLNEGVPGKTGILSTGGDPGRNEIMDETSDPSKIGPPYNDDLDLQTVLNEMNTNGVTLLEVHSTTYRSEYWKYWTNITGGDVYLTTGGSDDVVNAIVSLVNSTVSKIKVLTLKVEPGYESWVTWTPIKYNNVGGNETKTFDVTITVPSGTPPGDYNFKIYLIGDGTILGEQKVTIHVPGVKPTSVPEFPSLVLPIAGIFGIIFLLSRRKDE